MLKKMMEVPVSLAELPGLMKVLESTFKQAVISQDTILKMKVALDEIFSNIVNYSGAVHARMTCGVTEEQVYLLLEDDGKPYNPLEQPEPDLFLDLDETNGGGFGIFIVKNSMDTVEYSYREGWNCLLLQVHLRKEA